MKTKIPFVLTVFSWLCFLYTSATTYTTITDGNWSSASTWDSNGVPPAATFNDNININHTVASMPNSTFDLVTFVISSTGSLSGGDLTLTGCTFTNNGSVSLGEIIVDKSTTLFPASSSIQNNASATFSLSSIFNLTDGSVSNSGTFNFNNIFFVSSDGSFTNNSGANINFQGTYFFIGGTFNSFSNSNVVVTGTNPQTISGGGSTKFDKLFVNKPTGSPLSISGAIEVKNTLYLQKGSLSVSNNLTMATGSLIEVGDIVSQETDTIQGNNSYHVEYVGASKSTAFELSGSGLSNVELNLDANNTLTLSNELSITGNLTINSSNTLNTNQKKISIRGNWLNSGNFIGAGSEITFVGTSPQLISGTNVFDSLVINNSTGVSVQSASGTQSVTGTLVLSSGIFNVSGSNFVLVANDNGSVARIAEISGGSIVGNVTTQQRMSLPFSGWHSIGTSISGATIADINDDFYTTGFTGSDYPSFSFNSVLFYDETGTSDNANSGFTGATNVTDNLDGKGIWVYVSGLDPTSPITFDVVGTVNQGRQTIPVTYTNSGNAANDGWNLVPNPFPSQIDWNSTSGWTRTNIAPTFYVWNPVTQVYEVFNHVTNVGTSSVISSSQSFWVQATGSSPALQMEESVKTNGATVFKNQVPVVNIRVEDPSQAFGDDAMVVFADDATEDYDANYDAYKLTSSTSQAPSVSTLLGNGEELAINTLAFQNNESIIEIKVDAKVAGMHTMTLTDDHSLLGQNCLTIEDRLTGDTFPIELDQPLSFNFDPANAYQGARFVLRISAPVEANFTSTLYAEVGEQITFENNSNGADTYEWTFGDGTTSTDVDPVHIFTQPGVYQVTLTATGGFCQKQSITTTTIKIKLGNTVSVDELNVLDNTVGIFSNGNNAWVDFNFETITNVTVRILNTLGQQVSAKQFAVSAERVNLTTNSLASGVYVINVTAGSNSITKKIKL